MAEAKKQASGAVHARLREMVASGRSVTEIADALTDGNIGRVATLMGAAFAKVPKPEVVQGVWDARAEEVYRRALDWGACTSEPEDQARFLRIAAGVVQSMRPNALVPAPTAKAEPKAPASPADEIAARREKRAAQ